MSKAFRKPALAAVLLSANALAGSTNEANRGQNSTNAVENKSMKTFGQNNAY